LSGSVSEITGAPEVPPVTAMFSVTLREVQCQFRGPGGYPGREDRRQGHAPRAPDSEL